MLPSLQDFRNLVEVITCHKDDIVGIFPARLALVIRDHTNVWTKSSDAWVVPAKRQLRVQAHPANDPYSCTAFLLRPGADAELLKEGKIDGAVPYAPRGKEKWVLLETEPGYSWVEGIFEPQQFENGRSSSATPAIPREPSTISLPWTNKKEFSSTVMSRLCDPGDVLGLIATNSKERAVQLTSYESNISDGGWCQAADPTQRQFSVERGDGSQPGTCKAVWIKGGSAAELLPGGNLERAVMYAPNEGDRSVMLEAAPGYCWVSDMVMPQQYTYRWDM